MSDCRVPMPTYQRRPVVYVIGPVSGIEQDNRPAFEQMRKKLTRENPAREVRIPHDFIPAGTDWNTAMRESIRQLMTADCVFALDGWRKSTGARIEADLCAALGIPLYQKKEAVL